MTTFAHHLANAGHRIVQPQEEGTPVTVNWLAFIPAALGISLIPGANQLLGMRNAYRVGAPRALIAVGGRLLAFAMMIALVAFGLGAVLIGSEQAFSVIKWAGVGYLVYLGVQALRRSWRPRSVVRPGAVTTGVAVSADSRRLRVLATEEFLVAATNPKAVLLFAALLPQFVSGPGPITGYLLIEALVAVLYAVGGAQLGRIATSVRTERLMDRTIGVCLVGFAAALGLSHRPA
jgi:threonine/homoserine/homoserine lactone efflux protein